MKLFSLVIPKTGPGRPSCYGLLQATNFATTQPLGTTAKRHRSGASIEAYQFGTSIEGHRFSASTCRFGTSTLQLSSQSTPKLLSQSSAHHRLVNRRLCTSSVSEPTNSNAEPTNSNDQMTTKPTNSNDQMTAKPTNSNAEPTTQSTAKPEERKVFLIDYFRNMHSIEDQEKIIEVLRQYDTNEEDWYLKLVDKLVAEVYFARGYQFAGLSDEQIERLREDYERLRSKRLVPPRIITDEIRSDLLKLLDDDKHRPHFLAYHGIKQMKKFRYNCKRQIRSTFSHLCKDEKDEEAKPDEDREPIPRLYYMKNSRRVNFASQMRLWSSALDGQNLVLDFSLTKECLLTELGSIASQTQRIVRFNNESDQPFNLWFAGLRDGPVLDRLNSVNLFSPRNFINRTERHFTELFPRERLVYLSPDAEETIEEFDRQAVYVLGALVDRYEDHPMSYESAKQHGIRSVKLPLKEHVILSDLAIDLSFLSVFQMLNYMQLSYATWANAFRMYLSPDRRRDDYDIIGRHNPKLSEYNMKEIENYNRRVKFQYQNRIFQKMKN